MSSLFPGLICFPAEMFSLWWNLLIASHFSRFSFLFFSVPHTSEGHGRLLEVGGALRTSGTHGDTNPQPLFHPGGGLPVHRPALQQRPDGQRSKWSLYLVVLFPSESWVGVIFLHLHHFLWNVWRKVKGHFSYFPHTLWWSKSCTEAVDLKRTVQSIFPLVVAPFWYFLKSRLLCFGIAAYSVFITQWGKESRLEGNTKQFLFVDIAGTWNTLARRSSLGCTVLPGTCWEYMEALCSWTQNLCKHQRTTGNYWPDTARNRTQNHSVHGGFEVNCVCMWLFIIDVLIEFICLLLLKRDIVNTLPSGATRTPLHELQHVFNMWASGLSLCVCVYMGTARVLTQGFYSLCGVSVGINFRP